MQILFLILTFLPWFANSSIEPTSVSALLAKAETESEQGNFQKAVDLCASAIQLAEQSGDQKNIAKALIASGFPLDTLGKSSEAEERQSRAEKICRKIKDDECLGSSINLLAHLKLSSGSYEEGLKLSEEAVTINERSNNQKELAKVFYYRGALLMRLGKFTESLGYFNRSVDLSEKIPAPSIMVAALRNVGAVKWMQGEYSQALDTYRRCLELAKINNLEFQRNIVLGNRGLVYWSQGNLNAALKDFDEAQLFFVKASDKPGMATNLLNMGIVYMNLGDYGKSMESLQKAHEISVEIGDRGVEAECIGELGRIYWSMNQEDRALEYFQKAYKISVEIGDKRGAAYALTDVGGINEQKGNYTEALSQYEKVLKLYEEMGEKRGIAQAIGNIASAQSKLGKYELALANQRKAFAMMKSLGHELDTGLSRMYIATYLAKLGRNAEAEQELSSSIEEFRKNDLTDNLSEALHEKAMLYSKMGKNDESIALMKESVELTEKMRADVLLAEQKSGFLENKFQVFEDLILLLVQTGKAAEAFEYVQRSKARAFLDVLAEAKIEEPVHDSVLDERKKKIIQESTGANKQLRDELENENPDAAKISKLRNAVKTLDEEYANLMIEIRNQEPRFAEMQRPKILDSDSAKRLLDANSVLLEYFTGKKKSVLFAVTPDDLVAYTLPNDSELTQAVQSLREVIQKPDPALEITEHTHSAYVQKAAALYQLLIGPAASMLKEKQKIIIAPDGVLHYLPFESLLSESTALIDFAKLSYLGRRYDIEYVPSISVLGALRSVIRSPGTATSKLIAFADPALPETDGVAANATVREWAGTLAPLPYARSEVEGISKLYGSNQYAVYFGKDATEERVKHLKLENYRYIHFASHGLIDEENPQYSAMVLATEPGSNEDGYLTLREVFDLHFNADLIVLSACKTGLGKQIRGEGVNGLSRAFLSAGTSEVLVSLWNVYDASTSEFMIHFYKNLEDKKLQHAEALKQARLEMILSGKYSHPYYWAPFILIGDSNR